MQNQQLLSEAQRIYHSWYTVHTKLLSEKNVQNKEHLLYEQHSLERTLQNLVETYHSYLKINGSRIKQLTLVS